MPSIKQSIESRSAYVEHSAASSGQTPESSAAAGDESARSSFATALAKELQAGEPVEPGQEGDDKGDGKGKPKAVPKNLDALAEALGVEVSELYGIEVPSKVQGRKAMTFGGMKDRFAEWDSLEADRLAFSESRVSAEAELTK